MGRRPCGGELLPLSLVTYVVEGIAHLPTRFTKSLLHVAARLIGRAFIAELIVIG